MRRSPGWLTPPLAIAALVVGAVPLRSQVQVASPNGRNQATLEIRDSRPNYSFARDGRPLILPSLLGIDFWGMPALRDGLRISHTTRDEARVRTTLAKQLALYVVLDSPSTRLRVVLAPGGGQGIRIGPAR